MRVQRTGGQIIMSKPMGLIYGYLLVAKGVPVRYTVLPKSLSAGSG
jgi:hypothetical protein